jgi:KipI family sensor histidine kinase inhibitor
VSPARFDWQGERCLVLHWPAQIDLDTTVAVQAAAAALRAAPPDALTDLVPAYASLALYFDDLAPLDHARVLSTVADRVANADPSSIASTVEPRVVEVPVCYDPALAPDLVESAACLGMPVDTLVARHGAPLYRVAMLGFAPGFPYLLGLDPSLALPRRALPRPRVEAGSVAIGGSQTGIYPQASPGGWQLIGRTPLRLFDPGQQPPCPLAPGDAVRFVQIGRDEFDRLIASGAGA